MPFTEPTVAVAFAGPGAFLRRESVFDLLRLGQFNPLKVRVGTRRRVRRTLPEWMELARTFLRALELWNLESRSGRLLIP